MPAPQYRDVDPAQRQALVTLGDLFPQANETRSGEAVLPALHRYNALGLYPDPQRARRALVALERAGWAEKDISFLSLEHHHARSEKGPDSRFGKFVEVRVWIGGSIGAIVAGGLAALILTIADRGDIAAGAALGIAFAGGVLGALWALMYRTGTGDRFVETFVANPYEKAVVGAHDSNAERIHEARQMLEAQGALRVCEVDQTGRMTQGAPLESSRRRSR